MNFTGSVPRVSHHTTYIPVPCAVFTLIICLLPVSSCNTSDSTAADAPVFLTISAEEAVSLIATRDGDANFVLLDVRTPEEFYAEHLRNAVMINFKSPHFEEELAGLDTDTAYLVYCGSGGRSGQATAVMARLGFKEVYNLDGGLNALKQQQGAHPLLVSCGCN